MLALPARLLTGQGVYTITNKQELDDFMATPHHYDKFIVQSLVGNASWSSNTRSGRFFHVGTIPNRKNHTYVSDLRMMVAGSTNGGGFRPVAIYARRARKPLIRRLEDDPTSSSWEMLGTNLSVKLGQEEAGSGAKWTTETQRLLLMDRKDFNTLGIGIDDLIDAYVQTVLSVIAIDRMCQRLMTSSETTTITDRPLAADESVPSTLPTPIRLEPVSADPKTECLRRVQILDAYERDGRTFVREQVTESQRHFDMQLFEALNPDPALLDEILI